MKLYQLVMALNVRWVLSIENTFDDGRPVDVWSYTRCKPVADSAPVPFHISRDGIRVDFNPTAFGATVVSSKMADVVEAICGRDIQRIPANVRGDAGEWEVMNVLATADCIDHAKSLIQYFPADDPEQPNKPRGVVKLVLDPAKAGGHDIFKPVDWRMATIVSETLKSELEKNRIEGIDYRQVTDC